jgi:hypothetical protein
VNPETNPGAARWEENLKKAREAEYLAEQVSDQAAKEVWLRIAQSYLDLAKLMPTGPKLF